MSAYKKLNQQDAYISTYTARKSWIASGSEYRGLGINNIVGFSGSLPYYTSPLDNIHGGNYPAENSTDFNRRLIYESTRHLYYSLFQDTDNIATGSYDNFLQSSYNVSGSRFLNERFALFSLPKEMYGTHIEPLSVSITPDLTNGTDESGSLDNYVSNNYSTDEEEDPNGTSFETEDNLYIENVEYLFGSTGAGCSLLTPDYIQDESNYVAETAAAGGEYLDITATANDCNEIVDDGEGRLYLKYSVPRYYVGDVIYTHGQLIITDPQIAEYYNHYFDAVLRWKSNLPIFTHNYHCKIKNNEFNYSQNKTSLKKLADGTFNPDGVVETHLTGSDFPPYITSVGLYNDSNELVAVGKMASPTPKSLDTDMSIIVQLDMNFGSNRGFDLRQSNFIPTDPQDGIDNPDDTVGECTYYFTFRNYYVRSGKSMNQRHSAKVENVHPYPKDIFAQRQTGNQVTLSRDYTQTSPARGTALKMRVNPTTGWNDPHIQTYNNSIYNLAPAEAGETWTMSVYVRADQTTQAQLFLFEAREDGTYIPGSFTQETFTVFTGWKRIQITRTFNNPETAFVQARLDGPNGYYSDPKTIWWDGFKVEKNSKHTVFNSELAKNNPTKRSNKDTGEYILYRKRNFDTEICKKSISGARVFNTQDFKHVKVTSGIAEGSGRGYSAACYVDVTVTKSRNIFTGAPVYTYDWTQQDSTEYDETAYDYSRSKGFFISAIESYLLTEGGPTDARPPECVFESFATESCAPTGSGGGDQVM